MGSFTTSPKSPQDCFWAWHAVIDKVWSDWAVDKANISDKLNAADRIIVTFDTKVSSAAPAANTIQLTAGLLTVGGNAATTLTDVGKAKRYRVYQFSGFARPARGSTVNVVLTGTASFAGATWTFVVR